MSSVGKFCSHWSSWNKSLQLISCSFMSKDFSRNMSETTRNVPVIKFPLSLKRKMISKLAPRKKRAARTALEIAQPRKIMVSCDKKSQSMYTHEFCSKFNPPTITSSTWTGRKSPGSYLTIHPIRNANPSFKTDDKTSFESLGLSSEILDALKMNNFERPTSIQTKTIPEILNGNNVMLAAETGSGKTLAYLLPIFQKLLESKNRDDQPPVSSTSPLALVVAPTNELVRQVVKMISSLNLPITSQSVKSFHAKPTNDQQTPDILVATPMALIVTLKKRKLDLCRLEFVVIDECDTLLDDSFSASVSSILKHFNVKSGVSTPLLGQQCAQLILSSATYPRYAKHALQSIISFDDIEAVRSGYLHRVSTHVKHRFLRVKPSEKFTEFMQILDSFKNTPTIVFCNKHSVALWLHSACQESALPSLYIDGKVESKVRSARLREFLEGAYPLLITTDLLSRGLDTKRVKHVINYEVPGTVSDYIHRAGRVGRVGQDLSCSVTTLVSRKWEIDVVMQIEEAARRREEIGEVSANIKKRHSDRWNEKETALDFGL